MEITINQLTRESVLALKNICQFNRKKLLFESQIHEKTKLGNISVASNFLRKHTQNFGVLEVLKFPTFSLGFKKSNISTF